MHIIINKINHTLMCVVLNTFELGKKYGGWRRRRLKIIIFLEIGKIMKLEKD